MPTNINFIPDLFHYGDDKAIKYNNTQKSEWMAASEVYTMHVLNMGPHTVNFDTTDSNGIKWRVYVADYDLVFLCYDWSSYNAHNTSALFDKIDFWVSEDKINQGKLGLAGADVAGNNSGDKLIKKVWIGYTTPNSQNSARAFYLGDLRYFSRMINSGNANTAITGNVKRQANALIYCPVDRGNYMNLPKGEYTAKDIHALLYVSRRSSLITRQEEPSSNYWPRGICNIEFYQRSNYFALGTKVLGRDPNDGKTYEWEMIRPYAYYTDDIIEYQTPGEINYINTINNPLNEFPLQIGQNTINVYSTENRSNRAIVKFSIDGKLTTESSTTTAMSVAITNISIDYITVDNSSDILASEFMFSIKSEIWLRNELFKDNWDAYAIATFGWNEFMRVDECLYAGGQKKPLFQKQHHTEYVTPYVDVTINGKRLGRMQGTVSNSTLSFVLPESVYYGNDIRFDRWPYNNFEK